ncbi:MAG: ABC-F family ATP-binding cassette domain-containing protein [Chlamydiia bacterium]|nr:ABC-F family ATP-binding cassette domain-containing protein [Chlamydiia bacterium]
MSQLLVQFTHLFKSFGPVPLFEDISLSINQGDVFALIGENGAGKTTLLKFLAKAILPDQGEFSAAPNLTIGFLPQEVVVQDPTITVRDFIEEGHLSELERGMAAALEKNQLTEWAELHEKYEHLGGYRKVPIEKVLTGLKLETPLLSMPLANLSSGQRVRVALAKALIENPDLLLLDEPTNHLDAEMLEWLENTLMARIGATVIISHDRKFINATCNHVIELERGKLSCYGGNYDFYLAERERLIERQIKAHEAQEEERSSLKQKIKAFVFSKAKPSSPSDRNIMAYDCRGGNYQKSEARRLDELKAQLAAIETTPIQHPRPKSITGLRFTPTSLASAVAVELEDINKVFKAKVLFSHFSKRLFKGDRVVLTGPNGSGKTTLLKCIAGKIPVDSGQIRIAPTAKIAYLDQEIEELPMDQTPLEYFESHFQLSEEALRRELHKAALGSADLIRRPFSSLSVGQKKRLMLLSIILEKPNVLLLDEPTNHLDFLTLEAFETALLNFEGAILAVSHDSTFIEKIATQEWRL